jgi:hypothetical protein
MGIVFSRSIGTGDFTDLFLVWKWIDSIEGDMGLKKNRTQSKIRDILGMISNMDSSSFTNTWMYKLKDKILFATNKRKYTETQIDKTL